MNLDLLQRDTIAESPVVDSSYLARDGDMLQSITTMESRSADRPYSTRDSDRLQIAAIVEGIGFDGSDRTWNDGVLATKQQFVGGFLDDSITIVATIVFSITRFYQHRLQRRGIVDSYFTNISHTLRNSD